MKHRKITLHSTFKAATNALLLSGLALAFNSHALTANATSEKTIVVQVPQSYYKNPVRMLHPYIDYWHNRGVTVEKMLAHDFKPLSTSSQGCEHVNDASALVVLEPNIFYNPQMQVFHTQITAKIYIQNQPTAALTKPDLELTATGAQLGALNFQPEFFIQKAYAQALAKISGDIAQSVAIKQKLAQHQPQSYQALCQSIDTVTQPKKLF